MINPVNVNWLAVLAVAIVQMVVGFVWYSPMLFGNTWMKLSGRKMSDMEKQKANMPKMYGAMFLGALVLGFVLAHSVAYAGAKTLLDGALVGFWSWLGFIATASLASVLFDGKPFKLYLLNNGHYLVALLISGAVLAVWI